jgi:hypothetical protein
MKVRSVAFNNRRKGFDVRIGPKAYWFPYARLDPRPTRLDPVDSASVDPEIAREGFSYSLRSGRGGTVHADQVLDYNRDPGYLRDLLRYQLAVEARRRAAASPLSRREIIRRLGTSPAQFYRLLDQTNTRTSVDQLVTLLCVLDCGVEMKVRTRVRTSEVAP